MTTYAAARSAEIKAETDKLREEEQEYVRELINLKNSEEQHVAACHSNPMMAYDSEFMEHVWNRKKELHKLRKRVKKQILQLQHELIGLNVHLIPFWL
jgi:hypothetical protein